MSEYNGDDIYCDLIIPRKIDIEIVRETDHILAFYHTKPHWPIHIVIVPKQHISSFTTLETGSEVANELLSVVQEVAKQLQDDEGSARVLTNLGNYQDSKHLHFHVSSGEPL